MVRELTMVKDPASCVLDPAESVLDPAGGVLDPADPVLSIFYTFKVCYSN
jgi:hypothetical protein